MRNRAGDLFAGPVASIHVAADDLSVVAGRESLPDAGWREVDPGAWAFCDDPAGLPVIGTIGHDWIESLMNRTEPSPIRMLRPPGCILEAEFVHAVIAARATLSHAFGG